MWVNLLGCLKFAHGFRDAILHPISIHQRHLSIRLATDCTELSLSAGTPIIGNDIYFRRKQYFLHLGSVSSLASDVSAITETTGCIQ